MLKDDHRIQRFIVGFTVLVAGLLLISFGAAAIKKIPQVAIAPGTDNSVSTPGMEGPAPMPTPPATDGGVIGRDEGTPGKVATPTSPTGGSGTGGQVTTQREIIKNGRIEATVANIDETAQKIKDLATSNQGFVEDLTIQENTDESKTASIIIRVSAQNFDEVMSEIKNLAVKVKNEKELQDDTTDTVVELEVRISNLEKIEAQYLELLKTAKEVEDILAINDRLNSTRLEIEFLKASLKELNSRVDLATITVSLEEEIDVQVLGIRWRPLFELKQALRDGLEGLTNVVNLVFGLVASLPAILLLFGIIMLLIWGSVELFLRLHIVNYLKKFMKRFEE